MNQIEKTNATDLLLGCLLGVGVSFLIGPKLIFFGSLILLVLVAWEKKN